MTELSYHYSLSYDWVLVLIYSRYPSIDSYYS